MSYITEAFRILPIAIIVAGIAYCIVFALAKKKRKRPSFLKIVTEYILVGWLVMFLYVTQVMSFGQGMGEMINLIPLSPFFTAVEYGLNNAGLITQILLNILLTVPLGLLLPIVFPKRFDTFLPVFRLSLAVSVLTELTQLLTGRSADIDDVIANTLGGLIGLALYIIGKSAYDLYHRKNAAYSFSYAAIAALFITFTILPFAAVKWIYASDEVGFVYYGHLQPVSVELAEPIRELETTAKIYAFTPRVELDQLKQRLKAAAGFSAEWISEPDGTSVCINSEHERIFIDEYNTWHVTYSYRQNHQGTPTHLPNEEQAIELASQYLEQFQIPATTVVLTEITPSSDQSRIHLTFESKENQEDLLVWGNISIDLGEDGRLLSLADERTFHTFYKETPAISPMNSLEIAQTVGVGPWEGPAYIKAVEPSYYFNRETGYLIPTWKIDGELVSPDGTRHRWTPHIDARS